MMSRYENIPFANMYNRMNNQYRDIGYDINNNITVIENYVSSFFINCSNNRNNIFFYFKNKIIKNLTDLIHNNLSDTNKVYYTSTTNKEYLDKCVKNFIHIQNLIIKDLKIGEYFKINDNNLFYCLSNNSLCYRVTVEGKITFIELEEKLSESNYKNIIKNTTAYLTIQNKLDEICSFSVLNCASPSEVIDSFVSGITRSFKINKINNEYNEPTIIDG